MPKTLFCDLCDSSIKKNGVTMAIGPVTMFEDFKLYEKADNKTFESDMNKYFNGNGATVSIICPECYKVYIRFLTLRLSEISKIKKEIAKIEEKIKETSIEDDKKQNLEDWK